MPQFVYDDIVKKIVKRERYCVKIKNFSTIFNILKEHSQYEYKDGYKRYVRLVKFAGSIPCWQILRGYLEGFSYVLPKHVNQLKMNLQCVTTVKKSSSTTVDVVLMKPPYININDVTGKVDNSLTTLLNDNTGIQLTVTPDVFTETFKEIYPFVQKEGIINQLFPINNTGVTSENLISQNVAPISNISFTERIIDLTTSAPTIDTDNLAVDYENAIQETDISNSYDCTSYEFFPSLYQQNAAQSFYTVRTNKTATTKSGNNRYIHTLVFREDPTCDTQALTEIPLRANKVALTMYAQTEKWRQSDMTTAIATAFNDRVATKLPDTLHLPGKEYVYENLTVDRFALFDYSYGTVDTTCSTYIPGSHNESTWDITTMKYDTYKLEFTVIIEVLLVDMKKK